MQSATPALIQKLRKLMEGSSIDKDRAESQLKTSDPSSMPADILECWSTGNNFDKFRAGRVKEAWDAFLSSRTET